MLHMFSVGDELGAPSGLSGLAMLPRRSLFSRDYCPIKATAAQQRVARPTRTNGRATSYRGHISLTAAANENLSALCDPELCDASVKDCGDGRG